MRWKGSILHKDQDLEQAWQICRGARWSIGITRKKGSALKWDLMKIEKLKYTQFIDGNFQNPEDATKNFPHVKFSCKTTAS